MSRDDLLAALLVERYTPIPPHRVLLSLDQIEQKRIADEAESNLRRTA